MNSNIVDGRALARSIKLNLKQELKLDGLVGMVPFHIIYVGSDPVIDNYLSYKQKFGKAIGVATHIHRFDTTISEAELKQRILEIAELQEPTIIQLPLPKKFDAQEFLDLIPWNTDVDVLSEQSRSLFAAGNNLLIPPVTASIVEIINHYQIKLDAKKIVLVGMGKLVGKPMSQWLDSHGYLYSTITQETDSPTKAELLLKADVVITGVGSPMVIHKNDVSEEVIILDAGTSEDSGGVVGDVDPEIIHKAQLFTPVPGGIGPLTIALLYRNVVTSYKIYVHPHRTS